MAWTPVAEVSSGNFLFGKRPTRSVAPDISSRSARDKRCQEPRQYIYLSKLENIKFNTPLIIFSIFKGISQFKSDGLHRSRGQARGKTFFKYRAHTLLIPDNNGLAGPVPKGHRAPGLLLHASS